MRGWACVALVMLCSCSLMFTQQPAGLVRPPECTTSRLWPVVDLGLAGAGIAGGIVAHERHSGLEALWSGTAGIEMLSAVFGYLRTTRCRRAYAMDL